MPEKIHDKTIFSLLEVMKSIRKTISERYTSNYWIKAEMNKLNHYSHSGHCYPELLEKQDGKVVAQIKAILWKDDYQSISKKFLQTLKEPLQDGIKILFLARISFDTLHGFSLTIIDIDPAFTLGDLEREKQETITRMRAEGIFDQNKQLQLPLLPQRIAIISVETSKGYADFVKVLSNPWGYTFFQMLFPSILQGESAVHSIISQLRSIKKVSHHFDVVAIIRGGGGDIGLSCYNDYRLAKEIARFPIPVITGIGHATNETVVEMISFSNAITPTKIAEYLLQQFHNFSNPVQKAQEKIIDKSRRLLLEENTRLFAEVKLFRSTTKNILLENKNLVKEQGTSLKIVYTDLKQRLKNIDVQKQNLVEKAAHFFIKANTTLENSVRQVNNLDPRNILKRGFSITYVNGKNIKSAEDVADSDVINTILYEGELLSIADKKVNNE